MKRKKLFALILVIIAVVIIAAVVISTVVLGRGSASPTDAADAWLSALKSQDAEAMAEVYSGNFSTDLFMKITQKEGIPQEVSSDLIDLITSFEYVLANEQISEDGNSATVDVIIETYNFDAMSASVIDDYFTQAMDMVSDDVSEEQLQQKLIDLFAAKIAETKEAGPDVKTAATLSISKVDGAWKVDAIEDNPSFLDALMGIGPTPVADDSDEAAPEDEAAE